jgi:hypothetical protein
VRSHLTLAAVVVAVLLTTGCSASAPKSGARHESISASQDAGLLNAWTLPPAVLGVASLGSCEVGDSLTIVINRSPVAARLLGIKVDVANAGAGQSTAQLKVAEVRRGAETAELAAGWNLIALKGYRLRPVGGLVLSPASVTGLSYDFVVRLHLHGVYATPWRIRGLTMEFLIADRRVTKVFPQRTRLPPVHCIGKSRLRPEFPNAAT